ncbi:MAG: SufE family protein [Cyanobacteria bacterium P01_D01_bin.156]
MSVNSTRPPALDKIVKRFQRIQDPRRRYEQLLWYAKRLEGFPEDAKTTENKVKGCVSQVYIIASTDEDGHINFLGDSDAQITKGLVALLIEGLKGLPPEQIVHLDPDFIKETQLDVSLTPSRANGFYNIFKMMQQKAFAFLEQS